MRCNRPPYQISVTRFCGFCLLQYSPELKVLDDRIALQHFAAKGQFEGRHFKFEAC